MKVADYVLDFLAAHGIKHVFLITGGVLAPIVDAFHSAKNRTGIQYICMRHEQAAAMAADGYARFAGLGCAMATSGPGATNLITGIGCSYFDSIPVIYITGQVNTREAKGLSGVRQKGFQETDIVSIVKPITKYAGYVREAKDIRYALEAALWYAQEGRPGPVLIDIPIDVQMSDLPDNMIPFCPPGRVKIDTKAARVFDLMEKAKRPVIIYGAGAREYKSDLIRLVERSKIPCLPSWAALDLIPHDHPQYVSTFGVYGHRAGNFTVQNADFILAMGTRLDTRMTGSKFAPNAIKVIVDIDIHESKKINPDVLITANVGDFLQDILKEDIGIVAEWGWIKRISDWKEKYPILIPERDGRDRAHPLALVDALNRVLPKDAIVVADCGANLSWAQQMFRARDEIRLFSAYGYSPMGYSFPAAIGAWLATKRPVICLIGDGGFQINIQELGTLAQYDIPLKVFIFDNDGYGIIRQFQDELYEGRYEATNAEHGVSNPDFQRVVQGYGLTCSRIINQNGLDWIPEWAINSPGAHVLDVELEPEAGIFPKCTYGNPLENQSPLLPPEEVAENMHETD